MDDNDNDNGSNETIDDNEKKRKRNEEEEEENHDDVIDCERIAEEVCSNVEWMISKKDERNDLFNTIVAQCSQGSNTPHQSYSDLKRMAATVCVSWYEQKCNEIKRKLKKFEQRSIGQLIRLSKDPDNSFNKDFKLNFGGGDGGSSSHVKIHHTEATIISGHFELDEITHHDEDIDTEISLILGDDGWPKACWNEAEVRNYVGMVLKDAVHYVNWVLNQSKSMPKATELNTRIETSIFSNKPDHHVVFYGDTLYGLVPVLYVETKTESGQILDHIMTGKLIYGNYAFGVLTNFNKSRVMWKKDSQCSNAASEKQRLAESNILNVLTLKPRAEPPAAFLLPAAASPGVTRGDKEPISGSSPEHVSTSQETQLVVHRGQQHESLLHTLVQSDEYKSHSLFTILCNAIVASLKLKMEQNKPPIFDDNFQTEGRLEKGSVVMELHGSGSQETRHKWQVLPNNLDVCGGEWKYEEEHQGPFLIVQLLGAGATSRAWRAVVQSHDKETTYTCIIKYWIKVSDESDNTVLNSQEIEDKSNNSTTIEVANYKMIYGDFASLVGRKKLNSRWCVILPFFKPIPNNRRNEETLKKIEKVLHEKFYKQEESKSYQFKDWDWSWRHVGERDNQIVLFDLADLLVIENADKAMHNKYVKDHIEKLRERMPPQQQIL
jgi:hypothetical protein